MHEPISSTRSMQSCAAGLPRFCARRQRSGETTRAAMSCRVPRCAQRPELVRRTDRHVRGRLRALTDWNGRAWLESPRDGAATLTPPCAYVCRARNRCEFREWMVTAHCRRLPATRSRGHAAGPRLSSNDLTHPVATSRPPSLRAARRRPCSVGAPQRDHAGHTLPARRLIRAAADGVAERLRRAGPARPLLVLQHLDEQPVRVHEARAARVRSLRCRLRCGAACGVASRGSLLTRDTACLWRRMNAGA